MGLTDVLDTPPLSITADDARKVGEEIYGLAGEADALPGERDSNFLLATPSGSFVLKIANPAESPGALDMQQRALLHARRWDRDLPVAQPIPTRRQELVGSTRIRGTDTAVTLTTYLPGLPLEEVTNTGELRAHIIELLARLDLALRTFDHPELDRPLAWDLRMLPQLRRQIEALDEPRRSFARTWLRHFDNHIVPRLLRSRSQAVHNDFNPANLLVDPAAERISGVVDFGDMTRGWCVGDLAVATAYQCLGEDDVAGILVQAVDAYTRHVQLDPSEVDLVPDLVMSRLVQSMIISAWRAGLHPDNRDYILIHAEPVWEALQRLSDAGLDELRSILVEIRSPRAREPLATEALLRARRGRLSPGLRLTYSRPLHAVSAESVWITDNTGVRHLDAYNNVAQVGHGHPAVVAALTSQAARLNTNTRYLVSEVVEYADRLIELLPDPLDTVFFANSGSEANDLAWRIARTVTGRRGMIVTEHAYHGSTCLTMATSPEELGLENLEPWVATVPPPRPNVYSGGHEIGSALDHLDQAGEQAAAFACDAVFSSDGIYDLPPGYLAGAYAAVRSAGGLCIADEVQAGLGRVGERMWGFAADEVVPDIVTLGKPLGNGHPIAAVITTAAIAEEFSERGYYFSTFAGNPVSAAVGMKVLEVTDRERLPQRAEVVGRYLRAALNELAGLHEIIGEVRGPGLFIGVELILPGGSPASATADLVQNEMRERRVLIGRTGPHRNVLKIRPPLVFTEQHSDLLLETLDGVLATL